jgi:hypothetical protein
MNNLWLTTLLAATAGVFYFGAQKQISALTRSNEATLKKIAHERDAISKSDNEQRRLESLVTMERLAVENLRAHTTRIITETNIVEEAPSDPQKEGYWPAGKPYFYLSKQRLRETSFWPTTENDTISPTAMIALGMNDAEFQSVNSVYAQARERLRNLEVSIAVPTNTLPQQEKMWKGEKTTLFLPGLKPGILQALKRDLRDGFTAAIGNERGELLYNRIQESYSNNDISKDRWITLIREGDLIQIGETDGRGTVTTGSSKNDEGKYELPREFRHLFPNADKN